MNCPLCGEECCRDEVNVGVGMIYGPYGCFCGWSEDSYYDSSQGVSKAQLDQPNHFVDSRGGMTSLAGIEAKLNHFGLDGKRVVDEVFRPSKKEEKDEL